MLLHSVISTNTLCARTQRPIFSSLFRRFCVSAEVSTSPQELHIEKDCHNFLPWLESKAGAKISSLLTIGKSANGRALYAAERIQTGDCLLKVPYSVQLAPDNLPPEISSSLGDEVGDVAKVALLILHEKNLGEKSEWEPYMSCLPPPNDMHCSVLWTDEELEMIRVSPLHQETINQKKRIENEFSRVKLVVDRFPERFRNVTLDDFTYAYALVTSRAWESSRGVSMIPFADFLNHNGCSESYALCNEDKQHSEVIADRDIAAGDEVLIRYGKFSNATLLLDFGFTVSCNRYDQVQVKLYMPENDALYRQKSELLSRDQTPRVKDDNEFTVYENCFTIRRVGGGSKWGRGIPQSMRAFARVVSCNSQGELDELMDENDGRLARKPLKDRKREIEALEVLLCEISRLIEEHDEHMRLLVGIPTSRRRRLAEELLSGEVRVLKSASAWLEKYCSMKLRRGFTAVRLELDNHGLVHKIQRKVIPRTPIDVVVADILALRSFLNPKIFPHIKLRSCSSPSRLRWSFCKPPCLSAALY